MITGAGVGGGDRSPCSARSSGCRGAATSPGGRSAWSPGVIAQIVLGGITVLIAPQARRSSIGHFLAVDRARLERAWCSTSGPATTGRRGCRSCRPGSAPWPGCWSGGRRVVLVTGTVVTGTGPHGGDQDVERLPVRHHRGRPHPQPRAPGSFLALAGLTLVELRRTGQPRRGRPAGAAARRRDRRAGRHRLHAVLHRRAAAGWWRCTSLGSTLVWIAVLRVLPRARRPSRSRSRPARL